MPIVRQSWWQWATRRLRQQTTIIDPNSSPLMRGMEGVPFGAVHRRRSQPVINERNSSPPLPHSPTPPLPHSPTPPLPRESLRRF
ncbi:hypothetical protein LAY57_22455 [Argonema antarcticum A004/B2]|nr:hypothetical protein [Argonema antarcticum A004/B2]